MSSTGTGETVSEVFLLLMDLALKRGLSCRDSVVTFAIDETWSVTINGKAQLWDWIPPFHASLSFNGWPAGILGPRAGVIAAGEAANEDTLCEALRAAGATVPA